MKKVLRLKNLGCAHCADTMQRKICKIEGVRDAKIAFMTQRLTIEVDDEQKLPEIIEQARKIVAQTEKNCYIED